VSVGLCCSLYPCILEDGLSSNTVLHLRMLVESMKEKGGGRKGRRVSSMISPLMGPGQSRVLLNTLHLILSVLYCRIRSAFIDMRCVVWVIEHSVLDLHHVGTQNLIILVRQLPTKWRDAKRDKSLDGSLTMPSLTQHIKPYVIRSLLSYEKCIHWYEMH